MAVALFVLAGLLALAGTALLVSGATAPRTDVGANVAGMMLDAGAAFWISALFLLALGFALRPKRAKSRVNARPDR